MSRPTRQATLPRFTPPRVVDLTAPPRVGNWYLVPTAYRSDLLLPLRLPIHIDRGTPYDHAHLDVRFMTRRMTRREREGGTGCIPFAPLIEERPMQCTALDNVRMGLVYATSELLAPVADAAVGEAVLIDGRLFCPHRGADVTACPRTNGVIVCPLHGMRLTAPDTKKAAEPKPRRLNDVSTAG